MFFFPVKKKKSSPWRKIDYVPVKEKMAVKKSENPQKSSRENQNVPVKISKNSIRETEIDAREKIQSFPLEIKNKI